MNISLSTAYLENQFIVTSIATDQSGWLIIIGWDLGLRGNEMTERELISKIASKFALKHCICRDNDLAYWRFTPGCIAHDVESEIYKLYKEIKEQDGTLDPVNVTTTNYLMSNKPTTNQSERT